jgi:uncharacterized protein YlxW (UPF0749 family)
MSEGAGPGRSWPRRPRRPRGRPLLAVACVVVGFLATVTVRGRPSVPVGRLPRQFVLAGLIDRQQQTAAGLRSQIDVLRRQIDAIQANDASRQSSLAGQQQLLQKADLLAGLVAVDGPGLRVVLDDSNRRTSPTGNVNDLVIHSQDIQAVVNAMWRAGAEAVAVNDERLVSTSAVLCVGNTLLLNGTVRSPPYRIAAVGAFRDRFNADSLVKALHDEANTFGLRFSISTDANVVVPAYGGGTSLRYARRIP